MPRLMHLYGTRRSNHCVYKSVAPNAAIIPSYQRSHAYHRRGKGRGESPLRLAHRNDRDPSDGNGQSGIAPLERHDRGEALSRGASPDHCHLFGKRGRAFERRIVEVLSVA